MAYRLLAVLVDVGELVFAEDRLVLRDVFKPAANRHLHEVGASNERPVADGHHVVWNRYLPQAGAIAERSLAYACYGFAAECRRHNNNP